MASGSGPAGSVFVEVGADLTRLNAGLDQAQSRSKSAGSQIAGDLGRIEAGAEKAERAVDGLADAETRAARTGRDLGQAQDGAAQSTARVATATEQAAVRWQRASALGVGRASGATAKQIEEIAEANASAGEVSIATAKEVASAFAATGRIQVEAFAPGIRVIRDYAAATRQEIPAATDQLAKSLAKPSAPSPTAISGAIDRPRRFTSTSNSRQF